MLSLDNQRTKAIIINAYDTSSCGLGVQNELVKYLLGKGELNQDFHRQLLTGMASNLLAHIYYSEEWFGGEGKDLITRYKSLSANWEKFRRKALRSVLSKDSSIDSSDYFNRDEFIGLVKKYFGIDNLPSTIESEMFKNRDAQPQLFSIFARHDEYFTPPKLEDLVRDVKEKQSPLHDSGSLLELHIDKLELMINFLKMNLEHSEFSLSYNYGDVNTKLAEDWQRIFGEAVPNLANLIEKSFETIKEARDILTTLPTQKLDSLIIAEDIFRAKNIIDPELISFGLALGETQANPYANNGVPITNAVFFIVYKGKPIQGVNISFSTETKRGVLNPVVPLGKFNRAGIGTVSYLFLAKYLYDNYRISLCSEEINWSMPHERMTPAALGLWKSFANKGLADFVEGDVPSYKFRESVLKSDKLKSVYDFVDRRMEML